jgi:hyperosmotically inducible periplasmic protein
MKYRLLVAVFSAATLLIGCGQTDPGITTSVKSKLTTDDLVKARRIDVDTRDKVVTLTGEVNSADERERALQIARDTNGVTNVIDQLNVRPEAAATTGTTTTAPEAGSDAGITTAVKSKLLADPDTSGLSISVDTQNGMVTLTGTVASAAEKTEALKIARETSGVTQVKDQLVVGRR